MFDYGPGNPHTLHSIVVETSTKEAVVFVSLLISSVKTISDINVVEFSRMYLLTNFSLPKSEVCDISSSLLFFLRILLTWCHVLTHLFKHRSARRNGWHRAHE